MTNPDEHAGKTAPLQASASDRDPRRPMSKAMYRAQLEKIRLWSEFFKEPWLTSDERAGIREQVRKKLMSLLEGMG
jgi:hypothetical protein